MVIYSLMIRNGDWLKCMYSEREENKLHFTLSLSCLCAFWNIFYRGTHLAEPKVNSIWVLVSTFWDWFVAPWGVGISTLGTLTPYLKLHTDYFTVYTSIFRHKIDILNQIICYDNIIDLPPYAARASLMFKLGHIEFTPSPTTFWIKT